MRTVCLGLALWLAATVPAGADQPNPQLVKGQAALNAALARTPNVKKAKNVILFIGDGMGINSVTAGRIFAGQKRGLDGASYQLSFETFPYTGFSKTYSADKLVTDSANGISAIMTGVKTINAAIGVDDHVIAKDCASALKTRVQTLAERAKLSGLSAGIVTTAGVTDATPAGAYGHVPFRGWRADVDLPPEAVQAGCIDLARQLIEAPAAVRMDVVLGGDREDFLPRGTGDGRRGDGRDLTKAWQAQGGRTALLSDAAGLKAMDAGKTDRVLGLFAQGDLPSPVDTAEHADVPALDDMTAAAIGVLAKNPKGYFLMVESASIDKWHHHNNAYRALTDVDELSKAVQKAMAMTDPDDTLIIVTADHSHGLVISAGSTREEPIMGLVRNHGEIMPDGNGRPRTTLSYATGPGGQKDGTASAPLTEDQVLSPDYRQPALAYMDSAQHAGEDVPVYATGPRAWLLSGTFESSYIYQVMAHALDLDHASTQETQK